MNNDNGKLWFGYSLDNSDLKRNAEEAKRILESIGNTAESEANSIDAAWKKAGAAIGGVLSINAAQQFITKMFQVRSAFQDAESSMTVFLGSAEKAAKFMSELKDYAWYNMFDFSTLTEESTKLLAFGNSVETIIPILDKLSNIASGTKKPLSEFVDLYNKAKNIDKVSAEDLKSWGQRGVVITDVLKSMGVEVDASSVKFEHLDMVINKITSNGGMFAGLMEKQMQNLSASMGQLQDDIDSMFDELGTKYQDAMKQGIEFASVIVNNYEKIGRTITTLIATYGTYRAAIMSVTAIQKTQASVQYATEIAELQKLLPLKERSKNIDIEEAVVKGSLTKVRAEELIAVRAEVTSKLEALKTNHALAVSELESATASHKAALQRALSSKAMVSQRQMELSLARLGGDVAQIELAKKSLLEAQEVRHTSVKARKITADQLSIATTKEATASTAVETLTNNINTASLNANTKATGFLSLAKAQLTTVTKALYTTMAANPFALIATAVVALGYGLYKLSTSMTETEKSQKRLNDQQREFEKNISSETVQIDILFGRLKAAKEGTEVYQKAKDNIINKYGNYLDGLNNEVRSLKDVEGAYKAISAAAIQSAKDRAIERGTQDAVDSYTDKWGKNIEKVQKSFIKKFGEAQGTLLLDSLKESLSTGSEFTSEVKDAIESFSSTVYAAYGTAGQSTSYETNPVRLLVDDVKKQKTILDNEVKGLESIFGTATKKPKGSGTTPVFADIQKEIESTSKSIAKLKKEIADLRSGDMKPTEEGKTILSMIEDRQKELSEATTKLEALTGVNKTTIKSGVDANKLKSETAERLAAIKEAQKQLIQQEASGELDIRQERINLMEEGSVKTLEQIQLDYDKRMAEIAKHGEDLVKQQQEIEKKIWEAANPNWKEKGMTFKPDTSSIDQLSEGLQKQLTDQAGIAGEETLKKQADLLQQTLAQYQDYSARRLELEKKYNDDVTYLGTQRNDKNAQQIDTALAEAKKKLEEALSQLNLEEFKELIDWGVVFGDLGKLSTDSLGSLREKLATFISGVGKSMSPEIMKEVMDAFKNIDFEIADRKPLEQLSKSFTDYKTKADAAATAQKKLNDLQKSGTASTKQLEQATEELNSAQDARRESLTEMTKAVNAVGQKGTEVVNAGQDIVNMLRDLGVEVPEALEGALQGVGKIMSSLENVDLTKPFSIVTSAIGALSGLGSMIGSIFGLGKNNDSKLLKEIEKAEALVSLYNKLIDKQKEYISTLTGNAAVKQAEEAAELIQRSLAASRSSLEAWFKTGASSNHHSMAYRINRDLKQALKDAGINDIAQVLDFDVSQWEALQKNIELWAKLPEEVRAYGEAVIDAKDSTEQLAEVMQEAITGISFDSLKDSLDDIVSMADMTFEDISDSFEDHMSKAVLHMVKNQYLTSELKKWYDQFTAYAADEEITQEESDALRRYYEEIAEKGNKLYKQAMELANIDITGDNESSQRQGLSKGIAAMSQNSADELNGRFTALQAITYDIREGMRTMQANSSAMLQKLAGIETNTAYCKNLETMNATMNAMGKNVELLQSDFNQIKREGMKLYK